VLFFKLSSSSLSFRVQVQVRLRSSGVLFNLLSAEQTLVFTLDSDLHDDIIDSLEHEDNSLFGEEEPAEREDAFDSAEARQHAELMQEESRLHFVGSLRHSQRERAPTRDYYAEARMREFGYLPP
jgi:hypothetical protein